MSFHKNWDFCPLKDLPARLPAYAWRQGLIAGFKSENSSIVDLSQFELADILSDLYPKLSLPEFARLFHCLNSDDSLQLDTVFWSKLSQSYGWQWNDSLQKILSLLSKTPLEFQNWASEKKLGIKDMSVFLSLQIQEISDFLVHFSQKNPSLQIGRQILEWSLELYMMKVDLASLYSFNEEFTTDWHLRIKRTRFPNTVEQDNSAEKKLSSLPHPPHVKVDWQRSGDLSGLKVEFFSASFENFEQQVKRLEKFSSHLADSKEKLWSSDV